MDRPNDGSVVFGKESDVRSRARGEAWEHLPFGFYAGPGPTAWRNVKDPMDLYVAAALEASGKKKLDKEQKKNLLQRLFSRDLTMEAMREITLSRQMRGH